jgi:hypothetical protein
MRRPSLLSARTDLELLYSASQHFRRFTTESARNNNIAALTTAMYHAATNFVNQVRSNPETVGPESATADSLQHQYAEIQQAEKNMKRSTEFDYSPTIINPIEHFGTVGDPSSDVHHSSYGYAPTGHAQFVHSDPNGHPMMSENEAASMSAGQQGDYLANGISPFSDVLGMAIGTGWDDWAWQEEMRHTDHR